MQWLSPNCISYVIYKYICTCWFSFKPCHCKSEVYLQFYKHQLDVEELMLELTPPSVQDACDNSSIYGTNSDQLYISIHDESHGNNLPYLKCYNCLAELYNISLNIKIFTRSAVLTLENMADTPDALLGMVCRHNFIAFSFIYLDCMTINSLITIPESSIYSLVQQSFKHQNIMTASHEALLEIVNRYYIRVTIFSMLLWNCWIP